MHVTYDVNGSRVTVSVPYDRWLAGGHAPVGRAIQRLLNELDLQAAGRSGRLPS